MGNPIIQIKDLSKHFGGIHALINVNLEVNKGEILGLIGPNGAGKTTLFNIISGYYKPSNGEVHFNNKKISGKSFDYVVKRGIARTFQIVQVFPELSVLENVLVGALFGRNVEIDFRSAEEVAMKSLKFIKMDSKSHKLVKSLVLNDRKKLELARVLATDPKVLLIDEIIAGLNPNETTELMEIIRNINKSLGITIVFVEHVMKAVMGISDRIVVLDQGKLIADGTPEEISNDSKVIEAYLGTSINKVKEYVENN